MADPARYDTGVDEKGRLYVERNPHGVWVKWSEFRDYQAGQRRNGRSELVSSLGIEVVMLRRQLERLTEAGDLMDAYLKGLDGTTNGMLRCREAWLFAKQGKDAK